MANAQSEDEFSSGEDEECEYENVEDEEDCTMSEDLECDEEEDEEESVSCSMEEDETEQSSSCVEEESPHPAAHKKRKIPQSRKTKEIPQTAAPPEKQPPRTLRNTVNLGHKNNAQVTPSTPNCEQLCDENFCDKYCPHDPYTFKVDPCLAQRPPWTNYSNAKDSCNCHSSMFQERVAQYLGSHCKDKGTTFKPTQFIVDDKYYLFPQAKAFQKRPLWGVPTSQWEIDELNGKRGYRPPNTVSPRTPMPTFFQPLTKSLAETCLVEDAEEKTSIPILSCVIPHCPRKYTRGVHRDYRGKRPKGTAHLDTPPEEDPFIKKLMQEMQVIFNEFLARKVPIIWIYGRPLRTVGTTRRKYCLSLAETHGFTYISLDEEIAMLGARGSRAIQDGNPYFEGFSAVERLALPVCLKLITDKKFVMNRFEALEMMKFLMLKYFPTKGYIIDGFPYDSIDQEDFERTFYPITCGLYFLDSQWTQNKTIAPAVIPPLYFRRDVTYDENNVEEACGEFGLKTLKIIGAESLLDDEEKVFALHAVVDEYLDAYDEVLEGNEDVLRDDSLEYQTFGETVGYGLDLAEYMKRKKQEEAEEEEEGEEEEDQENQQLEPDGGDATDPKQRHFLELEKLKEMGWDISKDPAKYSSALFDLGELKVTPSQRQIEEEEEEEEGEDGDDGSGKKRKKRKHKHSVEPCPEGDEECLEKQKKSKHGRRHRKHRCKCRCRCHRRNKDRPRSRENDDDNDRGGRRRRNRRSDDEGSDDDGHEGAGDQSGKAGKGLKPKKGKNFGKPSDSESQLDDEMDPDGPLVYDKRWGYVSTKKTGKHPFIHLPRLTAPNPKTDFTTKEDEIDKRAKESVGVYALPHTQSHSIPDPYNTITHRAGDKPGDYLQDYPGPKAPDRYSKINRTIIDPELAPETTTPYTEEPPSGLRSMFSDTMSRVMAKNQADIRKIKYDKLKHKVGQVEYEIYQDDYRLPKYRFYKTYKDYTPEDFVKEKENYVPCANCFDSIKQAEQYNKGEQIMTMSHLKHERHEAKEEHKHQYGQGPLFNRIISCLCGEDNEAGFHIPGYKPDPKTEDNTDLEKFDETPDYRKKK